MNLDPQMLKAAHEGDQKAQYALYRVCFPVLMSVCMRYRRNEQDAVTALNNGFLKIIRYLNTYPYGDVPFEAWIRRIMINCAIDEYRKEKKWRELTIFTEEIDKAYPDEPVSWNEASNRLEAQYLENLLRKLPPMTQQVFNMFAVDGYTHNEISESLKISEGTSKWHVNHARTLLQGWIKAELKTAI